MLYLKIGFIKKKSIQFSNKKPTYKKTFLGIFTLNLFGILKALTLVSLIKSTLINRSMKMILH